MRYTPKGYNYLVTAVPKSDHVSLSYLRMLIHGPFKGVSDLIHLVKTKEGYYLQCSDLEKWPSAVLFNFCMASRVPIEFQNQLDGWVDVMDEGYPEVLAFLLSHSTEGKKFKAYRSYPEHGHHWFDPSSDWRRIIEGRPDLSGLNYGNYPTSVTPSNSIWGKTYDYDVVRKMDNVKAAEFYGWKHPPKKEKPKFPDDLKMKKNMYWDIEGGGQPIGLQANQYAAAINHLNQIHLQAAPNGAWAQVAQAIHDEMPQPPQPAIVAPPNWILEDDVAEAPDDEPDFDEYPDFDEEPLDDD